MKEIQATLSKYPIKTRLSLSGTLVVARDIAHAKLKERLDKGDGLPQYAKDHIIYYAGRCALITGDQHHVTTQAILIYIYFRSCQDS